jgi:hypothetical protein
VPTSNDPPNPNPEVEELPAPELDDNGYRETLEDDCNEPSLKPGTEEMPQDVDHD